MKRRQQAGDHGGDLRRHYGSIGGYVGFVAGLMSLLTSASEGTPFSTGSGAFLVLGFMVAGFAAGWLAGPAIRRIFENS
jgi:hypothetical protein